MFRPGKKRRGREKEKVKFSNGLEKGRNLRYRISCMHEHCNFQLTNSRKKKRRKKGQEI